MADQDDRVAHLNMIQAIISRLASNCFALKALTATLVAAVMAFTGSLKDPHWAIAIAALLPTVMFWALDAHYLHVERAYRKLYSAAAEQKMITSFDLDYRPYVREVASVWKIAWSWSVWMFYLPVAIVVLIFFTIIIGVL